MCFFTDLATLSDELLPGIPNSLVLGNLLHRIPWYSRPVLRAVSKAWYASLMNSDTSSAMHIPHASSTLNGLLLTHQLHQFNEAERTNTTSFLQRSKSFKFTTINSAFKAPHALSMYEEDTKQWRLLPPIECLAPMRILHDCRVASACGKVYVMGGYDDSKRKVREDVFSLDIGRGKWAWDRCKPMRFARCGFKCRVNEGKIYVVGGQSRKGEPDPEAYDIERDEWEVLPRVLRQDNIEWAMATYSGLAIVKGSLVAHGYWESQTGNVIRFHKRYDERERRWRGLYNRSNSTNMNDDGDFAYWGTWRATGSAVAEGVYDMRDGLLAKFNGDGGKGVCKWEALEGERVCEKAWCMVLEGGVVVVGGEEGYSFDVVVGLGAPLCTTSISMACTHSLIVSPHNNMVYTTLCKGDPRLLCLWQGHMDHTHMHVSWTKISLPGQLLSGMCAFTP